MFPVFYIFICVLFVLFLFLLYGLFIDVIPILVFLQFCSQLLVQLCPHLYCKTFILKCSQCQCMDVVMATCLVFTDMIARTIVTPTPIPTHTQHSTSLIAVIGLQESQKTTSGEYISLSEHNRLMFQSYIKHCQKLKLAERPLYKVFLLRLMNYQTKI